MDSKFHARLAGSKLNVVKQLLFFIAGVLLTLFIGCHSGGGGQDKPDDGAGRTTAKDSLCLDCNRAQRMVQHFEDSLVQKFHSNMIQFELAQDYIHTFTDSTVSQSVRQNMKDDYCTSFAFDSTTLGTFASLFCKGKIDGFRIYLAKYRNRKDDPYARNKKHFTVILVGTKVNTGLKDYQDILVPSSSQPNAYLSLQDYSNPCKPICPQVDILPTMPHP
jgi:hypothetical protein